MASHLDDDAVAAADKEMEERANRAKELLSQRYKGLKNQQVSMGRLENGNRMEYWIAPVVHLIFVSCRFLCWLIAFLTTRACVCVFVCLFSGGKTASQDAIRATDGRATRAAETRIAKCP